MQQHQSIMPVNHDPEAWIRLIFSAKAAQGGVVRRSIVWVEREAGRDLFLAAVRERGYHLLASSDQFIVGCNREPVTLLF